MKNRSLGIWTALLAAGGFLATETQATSPSEAAAFAFQGVGYFHRWSKNDQHEFTPAKQEDLEKWSDMITVNAYPSVQDGEGLAATANAVLENYQKHLAKVLTTNSIPRSPDRPAEHLITVVFGRPTFTEVAFARFRMLDGNGYSIVYSHRMYGEKIVEQTSAWLKANEAATEKALREWNSTPKPGALRGEAL